jgi:GAF domain-containing protein
LDLAIDENKILINECYNYKKEDHQSIALVPIFSGSENIGFLQLSDKRREMFKAEDIEFFEKIGNMIGVAFKRIRNENKLRENEIFLKKTK